MSERNGIKKIMGSRTAATLGWPVVVLLLGVLVAPYAAPMLSFLIRPAAAAFLGGLFAVVVFRTLSGAGR